MMGPSAVRLFVPRERQDNGDGFCQSFTDTLLRAGVPAILRLFTNLRLFKIEHSQECTDREGARFGHSLPKDFAEETGVTVTCDL
jgi:hypothetical protein